MNLRALFFASLFLFSSHVLAQQSYEWAFLNHKPDRVELPQEQVDSLMTLHFANMGKLAEAGHLLIAGPFDGGGGVFVFNTPKEMTDSLVQTDPAVQSNRWDIEQFTYNPLIGDVCPQETDQEMVTYSFLRFKGTGMAFSQEQLDAQLDYVSSLPVYFITIGAFDKFSSGMIVVFTDDPEEHFGEQAPAVQEGWYAYEMKKLWIAKNSFCEEQ